MFKLKSFKIILTLGLIFISCDFKIQNATKTFVNKPPIQLTTDPWFKSDPAWSPDGSMIAYSVTRRATNLINTSLNDEELNKIGRVEDNISGIKFDLSPDGTKIVYTSNIKRHLWILNLQDGSEFLLTLNHSFAREPAWSPDGRWIAFSAWSWDSGSRSIWVIPSSGGSATEITSSEGNEVQPSWSPDGKYIAYESHRPGTISIWIVDIQTGKTLQLTQRSNFNLSPDWSPDGLTIAYYSWRNNTTAIWTIPAKGGQETKLTNHVEDASNPAWSPDGSKIAYRTSQGIWISSVNGEILHQTFIRDDYPVWWPDGNSLVSTQLIEYEIIEVFSFTDSSSKAVTKAVDFQLDGQPTWYPDSRTMAFARRKPLSSSSTIWTIPYSAGKATPLIGDSTRYGHEYNPAISPDGKWLVFDDQHGIFLVPLFGGDPIDLTQYIGYDLREPGWAPDSKAIVCTNLRRRPGGLKIISIDSSLVVEEREIPGSFVNPAWSVHHPVFGSYIAAQGSRGIYIMSLDGLNAELVIARGKDPSWSPDGTRLAYVTNGQLYILPIFLSFSD